jgi:hypothetical protein
VNITLRKDPAADLQLKFSSGQPGAPGQNAVLTVGSVTTLPYGASAAAIIAGAAPVQTLNLSLPEGRTGPVGEGSGGLFFESRAAAASASVGTGIKTIRTAGFAAPGDRGDALYRRLQAHPYSAWATGTTYAKCVNIRASSGRLYKCTATGGGASTIEPSHTSGNVVGADGYGWDFFPLPAAFFQSADRLRADFTTDATDGGYWELVPRGGDLWIEQLGGGASYFNSTSRGTDNYQPLLDAIKFTAWAFPGNPAARFSHRIRFGSGRYWMSATVYVYDHVSIEGNSTYQGQQTTLFFPSTVDGFVFHQNNTGPGGSGLGKNGNVGGLGESQTSLLNGLSLDFSDTTWATDLTKCAIFARTTIHLCNVSIFRAPGKGVYYRAYAGAGGDLEGNANQWSVINLYVHSCKGDAFHVEGADVNGGTLIGLNTHTEVGGCGIRNESYLPNAYHGMQITGYGNHGVNYLGKNYSLIQAAGGKLVSAGGAVPGTDDSKWEYMFDGSPSGQFPAWVDDGSHVLQCPIYDSASGSHYYDPYVEVGSAAMSSVSTPSTIWGGTTPSSKYSNHVLMTSGGISSKQGAGAYQEFRPTTNEYVRNGQSVWVRLGGQNESFASYGTAGGSGGMNLLTFRRQSDGDSSWEWGFAGNDIYFSKLNCKPFWEMTTPATTRTFGRGSPQPHYLVLHDPVFQDPNNANTARVISLRDASPTGVGEYARGERYFDVNPSPGGTEGWVCTTAGAIHNTVWTSGVACDGNTFLKTSSNRVYRCLNGGTSTVQPVHTSGIVTGADGVTWRWLADGAPVFKTFGSIAA